MEVCAFITFIRDMMENQIRCQSRLIPKHNAAQSPPQLIRSDSPPMRNSPIDVELNSVDSDRERLLGCLAELLLGRFQGHWHPECPTKGSAYRSISVTNGKLDPVLRHAASLSSFPDLASIFPPNITFWIDPGCVSYRFKDKGPIFNVWTHMTSSFEQFSDCENDSTDSFSSANTHPQYSYPVILYNPAMQSKHKRHHPAQKHQEQRVSYYPNIPHPCNPQCTDPRVIGHNNVSEINNSTYFATKPPSLKSPRLLSPTLSIRSTVSTASLYGPRCSPSPVNTIGKEFFDSSASHSSKRGSRNRGGKGNGHTRNANPKHKHLHQSNVFSEHRQLQYVYV